MRDPFDAYVHTMSTGCKLQGSDAVNALKKINTGNHKRNLPRFGEDFMVVFSALPEVGWVSAKKCKQTHAIWEGFFSDSLYRGEQKVVW